MTRWIEDGTAELVREAVREESATRQLIARELLEGLDVEGHSTALNVWLKLPDRLGRADLVARLQGLRIGVLPSDPFVVTGPKPEAIRVGLGGPVTQEVLRSELSRLAHTLSTSVWYG
jgi:DNA-binding transcriptional MocR family regulator